MGVVGKAVGFGGKAALLRAAWPVRSFASASWFVERFLDASALVVRHWGPGWARGRIIFGRELGVWVLVASWLAAPILLLVRIVHRIVH